MGRMIERLFFPLVMISFFSLLLTGVSAHLEHKIVIRGAGATFPAPLYARWITFFTRDHPDTEIIYNAVGSGRGIKAIMEQKVDFGASDVLLSRAEREDLISPVLQIPMVMGPVVLAYNLPGIANHLKLDGEAISAIYLGRIIRWNDARLRALNPDIQLPGIAVRVTHRKDGSGTTAIFTDYLSTVSLDWKKTGGKGKKVRWPVSHGAGEGNDGVAQQILLQTGGIGYLEYKYAQNAGLKYAALVNRDGYTVLPSVEGVQAAEENTPASGTTLLKNSIVNAPGKLSYPIAGFTYLLVYRDLSLLEDTSGASALKNYLHWALTSGQKMAEQLQYTPLPDPLRRQYLTLIDNLHFADIAADEDSKATDNK